MLFFIRDAQTSDLNAISLLGRQLNTVNLSGELDFIEGLIQNSSRSFSFKSNELWKNIYLFTLVNNKNEAIGSSQIFAKHGTFENPHTFFSVIYEERYSTILKKYFVHKILKLGQCFNGPSEVGSLILNPKYRNTPFKLGKLLSFSRFHFMGINPKLFSSIILAELLPPLLENSSALWDAIGKKLTGLDYRKADEISRNHKEFILSLFPFSEIYLSLLPAEAQKVIGAVGEASMGAYTLLKRLGFYYSHRVDPFDGGPHFEGVLKDLSIVKEMKEGKAKVVMLDKDNSTNGILSSFNPNNPPGARFRSLLGFYRLNPSSQEIQITPSAQEILLCCEGQKIYASPLYSH